MEQFEQLLTCAICLDRYRNPKLLPCQHSFCMEPCMDGLVDYVRRQVKCPECRAEHRIPYQGVQGFPTNVTLQRFLELHIEITGELPDPTSGQIMERCSVCSEKSYCSLCVHCDKKVCADCKGAHMDILRREIVRINNQVRRGIHRLQDALSLVEKNQVTLLTNCTSVTEEIDEISRRLMKAMKDRTESLHSEIERYQSTEQRNLRTLKDNLEQELSNIQSNCELADKHMNDNVDWDDCELMDAKEIFLKTVEFIRNFEYENVDYTRRVRFSMATDPNQLVLHVANYGDLTIASPYPSMPGPGVGGGGGGGGLLQPPAAGPGLMRSKSDHRLASQFRQEERGGYFDGEGGGPSAGGRASPLGGRKFGERYSSRGYGGESSRYGRGGDDYSRGGGDYEYDEGGGSGGRASRRYRSRLASRHLGGGDGDSDNDNVGVGGRSVRFSGDCGGGGGSSHHAKERERVLDTEDASRGPLSGITRLLDSPRVMKRLQESEQRGKKRDKEPAPAPAPQATTKAATTPARRAASRQVSEDDEISKIKKQNKASGSGVEAAPATTAAADSTTTTTTPSSRPQSERVAALKQQRSSDAGSEESSSGAEPARRTPPATVQEVATSDGDSDDTSSAAGANTTTTSAQRKTSSGTASGAGRRTSDAGTKKAAVRSASSESSTSSESSSSAAASPVRTTAPASATASAGADSSGTSTTRGRASSGGSETQPRFQSRFLASRQQAAAAAAAASSTKEEDEDEEETESSSDSEETDSEEESEDEAAKKKTTEPASTPSSTTRAVDRTDIGPLLARSAQARDSSDTPTASSRRRDSRDEGSSTSAGYRRYSTDASTTPSYRYGANKDKDKEDTGSKYLSRNRATQQDDDTPSSRYGSSGYTSRFLNKSKSSAALSPEEDSDSRKYGAGSSSSAAAGADDSSSRYPSGRSRYAALKDRRSRLARSRSTHNFGGDDQEEQDDSPSSPTSSGMPASYLPSRYAAGSSTADLARSRSTHALKSRENSPERPSASGSGASGSGEKDGAALSSWARYLKNKYGNRAGKDGASASGSSLGSGAGAGSSTSASRRLSLGLPLRHNTGSIESSDDDQKNPAGSPTSPTAAGFAAAAGTSPRSQYLQKRRQLFKIGSRGSEPGNFTWPRGIAVGPDNSIVVADSSNHRVQVFDANGTFIKEFGSYGSGEGEFDCLAGVAVNRIGQFIIADRYNHRIQVMDPAGRFLRAFGSQGSSDGRFNYPWGVTTDALGFIYVCDKENHRVQVFQSDGTFVGKFGSSGSKPGQLEHPHYIAVSNTNRVIVSDSNNHRVQIFDVNGKVVTTFGNEGSEDGQFKFPRHAKRAKSSRPRGSHPSHRAITTKSTKPVTSNTSIISTSAPSTIAIKQGRRSGRPGLHLRGGLGQQPHPNLQPRRHIPESVRLLGIRGRGVQRTGGYSSYIQRQHPGVRSREPSHTSVLNSATNKRLNLNTAENGRKYGPLQRASLPIITDRFLAPRISLTRV